MAVGRTADGRWFVYWREGGRQRRKYHGRGAAGQAAAIAHDAGLPKQQRRTVGRRPARKVGPTLAELATDYAQRPDFNRNSRQNLLWRLASSILPLLGHRTAMSLTARDLDRYVAERRKPRRVSNHKRETVAGYAIIAREITDILAILGWAADPQRRLIPAHPLRGYPKPKPPRPNIIPPSTDEIAAILAEAPDHLRRAITLSWYTGLRPGAVELLSLTWGRWQRAAGYLRVSSAHKGGPELRDVPVHPDLAERLAVWYDQDRPEPDQPAAGPIIHWRGRPVRSLKSAWRGSLRRAGIDRPLRMYDLRHHFITRALEAGADIGALAGVVGSSPETLRRHYQHVTTRLRRETVHLVPGLPSGHTDV
jgi:site-specific recombinase XerD